MLNLLSFTRVYIPFDYSVKDDKTVELEVLGTRCSFRIVSSSNYKEIDKKYITPNMIIFSFIPSNNCFGCAKKSL